MRPAYRRKNDQKCSFLSKLSQDDSVTTIQWAMSAAADKDNSCEDFKLRSFLWRIIIVSTADTNHHHSII